MSLTCTQHQKEIIAELYEIPKNRAREMASIFKRELKNGTVMWRLMFRRKGMKSFITTFATEEEARKFAKEYEEKYVLCPETFTFDQLKQLRINEFYRKNNSRKKTC